MRKLLLFFAIMCLVVVSSVKAQSASDSSYARDLRYQTINMGTFPVFQTGVLRTTSKILKDFRVGSHVNGYTFSLSRAALLNIKMLPDGWDSHLFLLDSSFNLISDNWSYSLMGYGSRIVRRLEPGTYHLLACEQSNNMDNNQSYALSIDTMGVPDYRTLYFEPRPFGTAFDDSLVNGGTLVTVTPHKVVRAKGYSITIPACTFIAETHSLQRQIYLLDSNDNFVTDIYGDYRQIIVPHVQAGTYKFLLISNVDFEEDYTIYDTFTISVDSIYAATLATLNYRNVNIGDTIVDTLLPTDPRLLDAPINRLYFKNAKSVSGMGCAKGYSIHTSASDKYLDLNVYNVDMQGVPYVYLLDSNKRIIYNKSITSSMDKCVRVQPSCNYYIVLTTLSTDESAGVFKFSTHASFDIPTFYVDALNGNDDSNGLSPAAAKRTLDSAMAVVQNGKARIYFTENYCFVNSCYLGGYTELYPYGKNIRFFNAVDELGGTIDCGGEMVFGKNGDSLYFIVDSAVFLDGFINNSGSGCLEVNNLKLLHSKAGLSMFFTDSLVLNNCQIVGDTFGYPFGGRSVRLSGTTYSNNYIGMALLSGSSFYFENSTMEDNLAYDVSVFGTQNGIVELKSGTIRNNVVDISTKPELERKRVELGVRPENMAGLTITSDVKLKIGSTFSIDTSAYIFVDSTASIILSEPIATPIVAKLFPVCFDENCVNATPDYRQGRRILHGEPSLLRANYTHFALAHSADGQAWYIHPDGTIHSYSVGIAQAAQTDVALYPNPASDRIFVQLDGVEADEICVLDIYGKQVKRIAATEGIIAIGVQDLAKGLYFVQVSKSGAAVATRKLVKR